MLERLKQFKRRLLGRGAPDGGKPDSRSMPALSLQLSVLMVCSGNICRSPTAEAVLRSKLQTAGLQGVHVDSAGTHGFHISEAPDPRARAAAARRGYDLSKLRARSMKSEDGEAFDLLLAMDQGHLAWMKKNLPSPHGQRARLLMGFSPAHGDTPEVPDPYYGGPAGFEQVLDLVEAACDALVAELLLQARQAAEGAAKATQGPPTTPQQD